MKSSIIPFAAFCILLLFFATPLSAQKGVEELQKIAQFYRQIGRNLSFEVKYTYWENHKSKAVDTLRIRVVQNGMDYRMQGPDFEWLKVGKDLLWVDHHQEEMVLVNAMSQKSAEQKKMLGIEQIITMVQTQGLSVQAFRMPKNQAGLSILDPENPGFKLELTYDPRSHCLFKMNLQFAEVPNEEELTPSDTRINALYSNYEIKKGNFPSALKQFILRSKNGLIPAKLYQNYRVQTL